MAPTLSVCTAVYNDDRFLSRALESVAAQSREPDEYIIVDDGSTDRCPKIIAEFAPRYDFVQAEQSPENQGAMAAAERTHQLANSEYIFGFASDDEVQPGFFEAAMEAAERYPEAGVIFGDVRVVNEDGETLTTITPSCLHETTYLSPERFMKDILETESPAFSLSASTIYRRKALDEMGRYSANLGPWADTFAINTIALRRGACYVKHCGTAWTQRRQSLSQTARQNPMLFLDTISEAGLLMRDPQFSELYSEDYAMRWERGFRRWVIKDQESSLWHQVMVPFDQQAQTIAPHRGINRGLIYWERLLLRAALKMRNLHTRWRLGRHRSATSRDGDLYR